MFTIKYWEAKCLTCDFITGMFYIVNEQNITIYSQSGAGCMETPRRTPSIAKERAAIILAKLESNYE